MMINIASPHNNSELTSVQPGDVQPNAVDVRIKKVMRIDDCVTFVIDEKQKGHRGAVDVPLWEDGYWYLEPGTYEIVLENTVTIAEGEAGFVIPRSTLNRNGVFLTSGLYDSGYKGVMAAAMHVHEGRMKIAPGTRVGQFLLFKAESLHLYDGDYGDGKSHDEKYK